MRSPGQPVPVPSAEVVEDRGVAMIEVAVSASLALVLGWLAGMLTAKRAEHWCPVDGSRLRCLQCVSAGLHVLGRESSPS